MLHAVEYQDGDDYRSVMHRGSLAEMVVPYGDPSEEHFWRSAFDVGEFGLGKLANSLQLGCDCLGEIVYLDASSRARTGSRRSSRTRSASTRRTTGSSGSTPTG